MMGWEDHDESEVLFIPVEIVPKVLQEWAKIEAESSKD
jgi:hypothetical protein